MLMLLRLAPKARRSRIIAEFRLRGNKNGRLETSQRAAKKFLGFWGLA
jgi:hypothetical protein